MLSYFYNNKDYYTRRNGSGVRPNKSPTFSKTEKTATKCKKSMQWPFELCSTAY